jgi:hypothetical protein
MLISAGVGLKTGNFGLLILASVLALGLGGLTLSEGITTQKITYYEIDDLNAEAPTIIEPVYTTESPAEAIEIFVLGWVLLLGGLIFLVYTIYYSLTGGDTNAEKGY